MFQSLLKFIINFGFSPRQLVYVSFVKSLPTKLSDFNVGLLHHIYSNAQNNPTPIIPLKQSFFFSSFEFVLKNIRRPKNKYGYNFPFQVLPFNQPQNIPIGSTLIEYGSMKLKIEQVFIFLDDTNFPKKIHI